MQGKEREERNKGNKGEREGVRSDCPFGGDLYWRCVGYKGNARKEALERG